MMEFKDGNRVCFAGVDDHSTAKFMTAPNAYSSITVSAIIIPIVNSIHTVSKPIDKLQEMLAYLSNLSYACWNVHTLRYEQS
jgi:hypothetical protein